jgi:hypothetical protein
LRRRVREGGANHEVQCVSTPLPKPPPQGERE